MAAAPEDYSAVLATVGLANLEEQAINLSAVLEADGAVAQASLVRQAFLKLLEELRVIAKLTAEHARQAIVKEEEASRVRADTQGAGGPRLEDFIGKSDVLPGVEGSVGINDEHYLEFDTPVYWWVLHEEGSDVHVGRQIIGFFEPGKSNPSQQEFRNHPIFTPSRSGKKGLIRNPIPERRFVEHGAQIAETEWHARIRAAKSKFTAECARAVASAPPPKTPGGKRRGVRRVP